MRTKCCGRSANKFQRFRELPVILDVVATITMRRESLRESSVDVPATRRSDETIMSSHDFPEQFARNQSKIYAYILSLLPDWDAAEEVFQNTCVVLLRKQDQFDPDRRFLTWACGIAHNELRNYLRKKKSHAMLSDEVMARVAVEHERSASDNDERLTWLRACLEELKPDQRQLVERCYIEKTPVQALAESMGKKPNTLAKQLERIRRLLFECINRKARSENT